MTTSLLQRTPAPEARGAVDFDLHGVAGVRVLATAPRDVDVVERQLGPIRASLDRPPDIWVRFVERLDVRGDVRLIGLRDSGFTDDEFLVLRGPHKTALRAAVRLPADDGAFEIVCESGASAVPLLVALVNVAALRSGALPVHASACLYRGRGILATGWAKGGKTEALLGLVARGGSYVADEWAYVLPDGTIGGIPEPVRIWDWHLDGLPALRERVGWRTRGRFTALAAVQSATATAARSGAGSFRRLASLVEKQRNVLVPPAELFGVGACVARCPFDALVFVVSHASAATIARTVDARTVAERMQFSLAFEGLELEETYLKYRFALSDARCEAIEAAPELRRDLLLRLLGDRPAVEVRHPFPADVPALAEAIEQAVAF